MRFAYLILCDVASTGSDGKVNLLGVGIRRINPPELPVVASLALAFAIEGEPHEAEPRPLSITFTEPDGTSTTNVADERASLPAHSEVDGVPVSISVVLNLTRPFTLPGRYLIRVTYGDLDQEYAYVVTPTGPPPTDQT